MNVKGTFILRSGKCFLKIVEVITTTYGHDSDSIKLHIMHFFLFDLKVKVQLYRH